MCEPSNEKGPRREVQNTGRAFLKPELQNLCRLSLHLSTGETYALC